MKAIDRKKVLVSAMVMGAVMAPAAAQAQVEVAENEASATGYTANFTYENENATNVQIMGSFHFYEKDDERLFSGGINLEEGDRAENYFVDPADWTKDADLWHVNDSSYIADMTGENGVWNFSIDLPGGAYLYKYKVSYDGGENYEDLTDPDNAAEINKFGAHQDRSQFFVPYDAEKQNPNDDTSYIVPVEDEAARGTIIHFSYPGVDNKSYPTEIYLPANYDAEREEGYKVLYLSHGGGGEEGDWFYQGHASNIVDHLAAEGACEEFIIVTMNNTVLGWDYDKIFENTKDYLIPYIEQHYNASTEAADRAFAGLSMGGMTTSEMYYRDPLLFGYFGVFSGSACFDFPELDDYSDYKVPTLYLAAGYEDMALQNNSYQTETDRTLTGLADKLDELGIAYNNGEGMYIVQGGHDWYTWPQIIKNYVETTLWK